MVADDLLDMQESYLPMWMRGLRCIACGNIVDPLINHNRLIRQSGVGRPSKPEGRVPVLSRPAKAA
jgi:hypothetical protein